MPYAYDSAHAEETISDLNRIMSSIEGTLTEMNGDMRSLKASWEGSEQEEYEQVHHKWSSSAQNIRCILGQMREALAENTHDVAEMRNRVVSNLSGR
ncbi:WXG100 family type VII secretion target [Corynebacterium matruchotii]|jgi:WXG100 family type VII secretion target|uniref:WXG100 family type VII secretion target n=1 Tax=Corynebacterium matruchotii TaxID=43768 RepID=UPI003C6F46B9